MNRTALLPSAWLLDQVAGDPEWFPHPVRLIGLAISKGERAIRSEHDSPIVEMLTGTALTAAVVATTYFASRKIVSVAYRKSQTLGSAVDLILAWTCLAARNLEQEATSVTAALATNDLPAARRRLARIVGRDTASLDASEISRAVIETLAESASDGILAPLFYLTLGGVPLAMAYKAVNTLDSMIGHADERYFYFGKAAARLDDVANLLPARLTALSIVTAADFSHDADSHAAWTIWHRDGYKHKSPNAGQPESAMAGALHSRLGGLNTYDGQPLSAQIMGDEYEAPSLGKANKAIRLVSVVTIISVAAGMLFTLFTQSRTRTS
jgi:adenosylcobinamide-phosphate synthase